MTESPFRLHWLSWIFHCGKAIEKLVFPLLAAFIAGQNSPSWRLWSLLAVALVVVYSIFSARAFSCQIGDGELLIREGIFNKNQRHIPFARIQSVSQRRKLLHRLLNVTEVQLDSAAGNKPEAVMKVLSLPAAAALEELLRHAGTGAAPGAASEQAAPPLLELSAAEIFRLGLVSNRGAAVVGAAFGAAMSHKETNEFALKAMGMPLRWLRDALPAGLLDGHWIYTALTALFVIAVVIVVLRLLSVALAFMRYHGFVLELHGERLTARHGLSTKVRSSARLPRLQRFVLHESWLHRRLARCRLAVDVVGGHGHHSAAHEASAKFTELAPIATREKAEALLRLCLPKLDWNAIDWRPLHPKALQRRLMVKARWMAPLMLGLAWLDYKAHWRVPLLDLSVVYAIFAVLVLVYALAWLRFAALAECGDLVLFRSGVWRRSWVIVRADRLQNLRLVTAPMDRSLGLVQLEADIQGGPRGSRGLVIPCMARDDGEQLMQRLWQRIA